jgi:hypothetical protein
LCVSVLTVPSRQARFPTPPVPYHTSSFTSSHLPNLLVSFLLLFRCSLSLHIILTLLFYLCVLLLRIITCTFSSTSLEAACDFARSTRTLLNSSCFSSCSLICCRIPSCFCVGHSDSESCTLVSNQLSMYLRRSSPSPAFVLLRAVLYSPSFVV